MGLRIIDQGTKLPEVFCVRFDPEDKLIAAGKAKYLIHQDTLMGSLEYTTLQPES